MSFLRSVAKEALDHVVLAAKYLCCLHIANTYACTLTLVSGPSMLPTLNLTGDLLLVERVSPKLGKVRQGDVVLVKSPVEPRKNLAKRVIALEGDNVTSFVDPLSSDHCQTVVDMYGYKETISMHREIHGITALFLMGSSKGKSFAGYGLCIVSDHWIDEALALPNGEHTVNKLR